jgi:hypothetical protein
MKTERTGVSWNKLALALWLSGAFVHPTGSQADEILPAEAASEDLRSFDRSIVVPTNAPDTPSALRSAMSAEADELRRKGDEASKDSGSDLSKRGKSDSSSSRESSPSNAAKNSRKKSEDEKTHKKPKASKDR